MRTINTPEKISKCWGNDHETRFRGSSSHWIMGYNWFSFGKQLGPISTNWNYVEGRSWTRIGLRNRNTTEEIIYGP